MLAHIILLIFGLAAADWASLRLCAARVSIAMRTDKRVRVERRRAVRTNVFELLNVRRLGMLST